MAEASAPPTFKLVLVGDGGTGKVRTAKPALISIPPPCDHLKRMADAFYLSRQPSSSDILQANSRRNTSLL